MALGNVESKLEQAAAAYVTPFITAAGIANVLILTGRDSASKIQPPMVICEAKDGVEDFPDSGNFVIEFIVAVESAAGIDANGIDPRPADDLLVGTVFNAFLENNLAAQLSLQVADFTCMAIFERSQNSGQNGDLWRNELRMRAYCCPSTLSP